MIALAFYLLRDDRQLADWVVSTADDERGVVAAFGTAVDRDLNAIFFGNILNAVLTGTIGVIAYTLLNVFAPASQVAVPAAGLVGLLAGVASIIPVVGMKLVYVPVALYMAAVTLLVDPQLLWFVVAFAAISFVVVDTIPDLVLRPYVSGRSLHVGSVMIAYTFGPLLFGWYGIFLMPMLLVLVFHFGRIVLPELIGGYDITPGAVDPGILSVDEHGTPVGGEFRDAVAESESTERETDQVGVGEQRTEEREERGGTHGDSGEGTPQDD
jgi:predicted PurR-regulated permease PerM